jgi:hypothetical protein
MQNLNSFAANQPGARPDESQFERSFRWRGLKRHAELARDTGELAPVRTGKRDLLALLMKRMDQFHALVISAAAGEH